MKTGLQLSCLLGGLLLLAGAVRAAAPSPESIDQLLTITHAEKLAESQMKQYEGMMAPMAGMTSMADSLPPKAQATIDKLQKRLNTDLTYEMSWARLKTIYIQVYADSFSQEEVDGMIAFYKTPAGQALVNKMPLVLQQVTTIMQARMAPILQRVQSDVSEMIKQTSEAAEEVPAKAGSPDPN